MRKILVVGVGGSGGETLRFMIDQLKADLRPYGVTDLPPAWQFLHIDVPPTPEATKGLGSIRDLGGRYLSVSSPGNNYQLVANRLEQQLGARGALRELVGWAPAPKERCTVDVTTGAGQYRSVGRSLTLTDLSDILAELNRTWEQLQRPDAWADLPTKHPGGGPYPTTIDVVPLLVGSMAGGSGASMFLDVCRLMGRVSGLNRTQLGVFLYTADVFAALAEDQRAGVDGNALAAIGEVIAAQSRASDAADASMFEALGIPPDAVEQPAFTRLFPIGSAIGGDGARFGDGSQEGVFRGLGRALAATFSSERAGFQYVKSKVENPNPPPLRRQTLTWGVDEAVATWGSFGYASLSLGRDRYAEYAGQRMARNAFDHLTSGHLTPGSQVPGDEQLNEIIAGQFPTILARLRFPVAGASPKQWFLTQALTDDTLSAEARVAIGEALAELSAIAPGQASAWLDVVRVRLPQHQETARRHLADAAYRWAYGWAAQLELAVRQEYLRAMTQLGIPYANRVMVRLREHLSPLIDALRSAPPMGDPLVVDQEVASKAAALKKTLISATHAVGDEIGRGFLVSAKGALEKEAARLGAEVLASYAGEVLVGLQRAGLTALENLEAAQRTTASEAGLAQLESSVYAEWPLESDLVPSRFDHADNEVLLTTAADFPVRFRSDVQRSVAGAATYDTARDQIVREIVIGRWETTGGVPGDFTVLEPVVDWRPGVLPVNPATKDPITRSQPAYRLAVTPVDLRNRAIAHLGRPDQPFQQFSTETIDHYLSDPTQSDAERAQRMSEFLDKFREAMALARPLVGVNAAMVHVMHDQAMRYQYTFGEIPLAQDAVGRLRDLMAADASLDESTASNFDRSVIDPQTAPHGLNKIAIFGSHPKYSPLVFSSLLDQIQKRWAAAPEHALTALWTWKRTRPLPAGLAMSSRELSAMIGGWFIARLLGAVIVPAPQQAQPAQVWDFERSQWLAFPARMLTPPSAFKGAHDWLPAVLESHSLAIVQCNGDTNLSALRPYVALRSIRDDTPESPFESFGDPSGFRHLRQWITSGQWPAGRKSDVARVADAESLSPGERATAARVYVQELQDFVSDNFLTEEGVGLLARRQVRIQTVQDRNQASKFAELAPIVMETLTEIGGWLDQVVQEESRAAGGTPSGPLI